jgi:hypothetical protein
VEDDGDDDGDGVGKWKKEWTMIKVVKRKKREEIVKETGAVAGSPDYLRRYAGAVKEVLSRLTDEEKRMYMGLAREWNKSRPPRDIQLR